MSNVILLGHKARQGKDTFATLLAKHSSFNVEIVSFSDTMKDILADIFDISREELEHLKNTDEKYRAYHQRFGSGKMKEVFGEDVWVKLLQNKLVDKDTLYVVKDFRFHIEHIPNSITVKVTRNLVTNSLINHEHISETALDNFIFDYTINNDATLADLELQAIDLLHTIGWYR